MRKQRSVTSDIIVGFGKRVRQIRIEKVKLSQEQLADRAGLHRTFIGRVERGETNITLENIVCIVRALDVSLADFFEPFKEAYE